MKYEKKSSFTFNVDIGRTAPTWFEWNSLFSVRSTADVSTSPVFHAGYGGAGNSPQLSNHMISNSELLVAISAAIGLGIEPSITDVVQPANHSATETT